MARTKTVTLYTFDELSPKAQEKARDWYRDADAGDNDFAEFVIEDAVRMAAILGFEMRTHAVRLMNGKDRQDPSIWWNLGYTQGDGVWIEASYAYAKQAHTKIRAEAPIDTPLHSLADRLLELQRPYRYQLTAQIKDDERGPMRLEVEHPTKEVQTEAYEELRSIVRDFERWIYNGLRTEDEYRRADAQVEETIRANEYEFDVHGNRED